MKKIIFILLIVLFVLPNSFSQIQDIGILPYVKNYKSDEYKGPSQIWAAIQDEKGVMFFGSTDGIMQFDGKNWQKIIVTNDVVRSFNVDNKGVIYVGGKSEIGYLQANTIGTIEYKSLINKIPTNLQNFGDVWNIMITDEGGIYFHTYDAIYIYEKDTFNVVKVDEKGLFARSFIIGNDIYVQDKGKGLEILENGKFKFIPNSEIFASEMVKEILPYNDKLIFISWSQGIYEYDGVNFAKIETPIDKFINTEIYKVISIKDEYFAFALNQSGLLITDRNFNLIQYFNTDCGLQNDAVRDCYLDNQENLWLCLENGISCIPLFDPFTKFGEAYGLTDCKTYSSVKFNNNLYIGTSAGVFYKDWTKKEDKLSGFENFNYVANDEGKIKINYLNVTDNKVFAASLLGLYEITDNKASYILKNRVVRTFTNLKNYPDRLICGSDVLFSFKKENNQWFFEDNIAGFEHNSRFIEEDENGYLWISNIIEGIYKVKLNENFDSVENYILYDTINGLNGLPSHLDNYVFKTSSGIVFGTKEGIYQYDEKTDTFYPNKELNDAIGSKVAIVMIKEDLKGNIWYKDEKKDKDDITIWELGELLKTDSGFVLYKTPFYKYRSKIFSFDYIDENTYVIGAEQGFVLYNALINKDYNHEYPALVRKVQLIKNDSIVFGGQYIDKQGFTTYTQDAENIPVFSYKFNSLRFTFSATFYDEPENLKFKYFLKGNDEAWSDWKTETSKEYSNLKPGDYTFYVKAKNIYEVESIVAEYKFVIRPPWYLTFWAFLGYFFAAILVVYLITIFYTRRLRMEKERLERIVAERTMEIMEKNAELEQQKEEISAQRDLLFQHNEEIKEKNKNITSSITYAKRIQDAMLPLDSKIEQYLDEYFILFRPRDIVSGDFYYFAELNGKIIFTAVDCTGHGVPGAFMSMIGSEILTTILSLGITDSAEILNQMNKYIRTALKQDKTENQDGMDMALCVIDKKEMTVEFSGAKNPLVYIMNDELFHVKGDKQAVGGHQIKENSEFQKTIINYQSPAYFYMFSDGYPDQFGGPNGRKFMIKSLKELIFDIYKKPMAEQKTILNETIVDWMKLVEQTDDIIVTGFKL